MAKSSTERHMDWRNRVMLKARIFDDLNAERAARIRQAFPGDERPEVRAVVEFFANYPRCQAAPNSILLREHSWLIDTNDKDPVGLAALVVALEEISSLPVYFVNSDRLSAFQYEQQVRDEVAEMRALGLWGRP